MHTHFTRPPCADIATSMQYQARPSYHGPYPPQSNAYGGTQYPDQRSSYGYSTQNATPQMQANVGGYGSYTSTPAYPSGQNTACASSSGSYESPRASKRPRLDGLQDDGTPTRSSGGWMPSSGSQSHYTNQQQHRGLALPQMQPPPPPAHSVSHQVTQDMRHTSQPSQVNGISSQLAHQARGLAEYDGPNGSRSTTAPSDQQHQSQPSQHGPGEQTTTSPAEPMLPERGAKDGNILNLSCSMCMKKKRKCSKNFPCTECDKFGDECVPSKRKVRPSAVGTVDKEPSVAQEEESEMATEQASTDKARKRYVRDHNDPNRKYLLNLPRVVDGYQQWTNMSLPYHPFPDNLDAVREKIFKLEKPLLLNSQQYADYWPHISNIYARGVGPWWEKNGIQLETWECRNQRRQSRHQRVKEPMGQGIRKRVRKLHLLEGTEMCKVRFRLHAFVKHALDGSEDHTKGLGVCNCVPEWVFIDRMRASADLEHNHALESLDKYKRTDALLFFAEQKVREGGYLYAAVRKWIYDHYSHVTKEVQYLSDHDVANAARKWRVQNRELELLDTIPDPNPDDERRERCLELLPSTKLEGLQRAMREICNQLPEATKIALPLLESSQIAGLQPSEDNSKFIEGDDIVIPQPGVPGHRLNTLYKMPDPPPKSPQPVINQNSNMSPPAIGGTVLHLQSQGCPSIPMHAVPQTNQPHGLPLPRPPLPAQSQLPPLAPMAPPQPIQTKFHVYQPRKQALSPPGPISGAYSVISGGHRVQIPTAGSKMAEKPHDTRPSWAKPDKPPPVPSNDQRAVERRLKERGEQSRENEETRVKRQLEDELQA